MKVSVKAVGELEKRLTITVSGEDLASGVQRKLQSIRKTARVNGFRPGKAPFKVIEQRHAAEAREQVAARLMREALDQALEQENLIPAVTPTVENIDDAAADGLVFTALVEVFPTIKLAPVEKLRVEKPRCEVTEEDVDAMVEIIRRQNCNARPVERAALAEDVVVVDCEGRIDGQRVEVLCLKDQELALGREAFVEGFTPGLIGASAGECRTLSLKLPEDHPQQTSAGKEAEFVVEIKAVEELLLPALDQEFFAAMGVPEGGAGGFRDEVRKDMQRQLEDAVRERLKTDLMERLYAGNKVQLPPTMVAREEEKSRERFVAITRQAAPDHEQSEQLRKQAEKMVALRLIFDDIIKKNEIKPEPSRVRGLIEKRAASYQNPSAMISWYYSDLRRLQEMESVAMQEQVFDWVIQRARIEEKPVSFKELMNQNTEIGLSKRPRDPSA